MIAMTVGQGLGTVAFAMYGFVIVQDLRRIRRDRRTSSQSIPLPVSKDEPSS